MSSITSVVDSTILFFHAMSGNWALSIAALALLVKVLLFPIQLFNYRRQRLMAKIQPELEGLQKIHKDEPMVLFKKMSELKKREGVKTGLSLVTTLLQIPIFISVYRSFSSISALFSGNFLWLTSLTAPDPFYIFPALVGLGSYIQQRLNPLAAGISRSETNQILKWMPAVSFVFMVSLPSSLVFYYTVSGALNVISEYWIRRAG